MGLFDEFEPVAVEEVQQLSIRPRDYQQRAIDKTFELFDGGTVGVIVRAPTGSGKTLTATFIAEEWLKRSENNRVLIVAHERQLIQQFADEVRDVLGGHRSIAIEMSSQHCTGKKTLLLRVDKPC